MKPRGFTLLELVVVVSIVGMLVVTTTGLFFRALRGGTKTDVTVTLDRNALLVMGIIERFVRNAQQVTSTCPGTSGSVTVLNPDGRESTFSLTVENRVASNGADITAEEISITDLSFVCTRTAGAPDQVEISFTAGLTAGGDVSSNSYSTTVNLRNF